MTVTMIRVRLRRARRQVRATPAGLRSGTMTSMAPTKMSRLAPNTTMRVQKPR
jgi:hypothetical protein